jgi:O-antigen/teichoic acid export membrane protein
MSVKKGRLSFANDVAWSLLFDGSAMVANIITFILLGRNLGDEGYGAYVGLFGITGPLSGLAWAGVGLAALQRILRDEHDPAVVTRRMLGQGLLTGVAALPVALIIGSLAIRSLDFAEIFFIVVSELLAVNVIMVSAFVLQGVAGIPTASRLRMTVIAVRLITVLGLFFSDQLSILGIGISNTILLSLVTLWVITKRLPNAGIDVRPGRPMREDAKIALSFSIPMVGSNLQLDGDKTILNAYGMSAEAGVYGAAFRVVNMAFTPIRALQAAAHNRLLPQEEGSEGLHVRRTRRFAALNFVSVLPICVVLYFAVGLFEPLLGDDFEESARIARWLLPFLPLKAMSSVPSTGLLGLGRTGTRAKINLGAAAVSLVLYIILIPQWGWAGAVVGTIIGELSLLILGSWRLVHWQRHADEEARNTIEPLSSV